MEYSKAHLTLHPLYMIKPILINPMYLCCSNICPVLRIIYDLCRQQLYTFFIFKIYINLNICFNLYGHSLKRLLQIFIIHEYTFHTTKYKQRSKKKKNLPLTHLIPQTTVNNLFFYFFLFFSNSFIFHFR